MDAARVKPGLHVTINVKFSPVHDEKVIAEISFLTFNPDNPETFHELRVPVLCTQANPEPVVDPTEVRLHLSNLTINLFIQINRNIH